jgi:hypothetical protein
MAAYSDREHRRLEVGLLYAGAAPTTGQNLRQGVREDLADE